MDISSVPRKCIALEKLPIKDGKIRRLFIIADGKRTVSEIVRQAMVSEQEGIELLQELVHYNYLSTDESINAVDRHDPTDFLEIVTEKLANFVGPFAAVAMEPYADLLHNDSDKARQEVIDAALAEIDTEDDRKSLLEAFGQTGCLP